MSITTTDRTLALRDQAKHLDTMAAQKWTMAEDARRAGHHVEALALSGTAAQLDHEAVSLRRRADSLILMGAGSVLARAEAL